MTNATALRDEDVERVARAVRNHLLQNWPDGCRGGSFCDQDYAGIARAALSALQPRVPEGFWLAPDEPTWEMCAAGGMKHSQMVAEGNAAADDPDCRFIFEAMKAAAPPPPAPAEGERLCKRTLERAAQFAEQKVDRYHEGMSAVDVRLSYTTGPKWKDGPAIAAAIRALAEG